MSPLGTSFRSLLGAAGSNGYTISQSLRFNDDDSAHLTRSPSADGNLKLFSFSIWYKRASLAPSSGDYIITAPANSTQNTVSEIGINTSHKLDIGLRDTGITTVGRLVTTQVFRDPGAWGHLLFVWDSANATEGDRMRVYHNGTRITVFDTETYPSQNTEIGGFNRSGKTQSIGRWRNEPSGSTFFCDMYMAEFIFTDGIALSPTDIGEFDGNGVWRPKQYTGSYGTNGFYLDFANSADLGNDVSGNNNDFTPSGLAANDKMLDSPTDDAANNVGNYMVFDSLQRGGDADNTATISDGGLVVTHAPAAAHAGPMTSRAIGPGGKWYCETTFTTTGSSGAIGVVQENSSHLWDTTENSVGFRSTDFALTWADGNKLNNNSSASYGSSFTTNDVMMIAVDLDNGKIWWGKNGTWFNSGDPAVGTNAAYTTLSTTLSYFFCMFLESGAKWTWNFGQSAFVHTIPTGFKRINTANLPAPTVTDPSKHFQAQIFTGTGAENAITLSGNSTFQPDIVWIKDRDTIVEHVLVDSVRGATLELNSDSANNESTVAEGLKSFDSSGFTLGTDSNYNAANSPNVAWCWRGNGSGSSNTSGSITSTVSANTTSGFSIVTYTGTGANGTVGHGIGAAPKFVLVKQRADALEGWFVFHTNMTNNTYNLHLHSNSAEVSAASDVWNSTDPSSSVVSLGTRAGVNQSTKNYVMYCFAEVSGFSKIGKYTGNGSADGPFVWCGFRPAIIITKRTGALGSWGLLDVARDTYNPLDTILWPDLDNAEATSTNYHVDFLSNGFKIRSSDTQFNASDTFIFAAFAENPFGGSGVTQARAR
ncbi:MAG: hypothetical protein HYT93_01830 [Parcubacteria group bacterium]|nr:hypothetical protein [Parcubacteria group bacterium]